MRGQPTRALLLTIAATSLAGCAVALSPQTKNEISIKISSSQPAIKACYEKALKRDENVAGSVNLSFVVAPTGQFTNVQVAGGTLPDAEVKQCVVQQVSTLRVATAPPRPVVVSYPLDFQPEPVP